MTARLLPGKSILLRKLWKFPASHCPKSVSPAPSGNPLIAACPKSYAKPVPSSVFQMFCSTSWKTLTFSSKKTISICIATKKAFSFISFPDFIHFMLWSLGQASSGEGLMAAPKQMGHGDVTQKTWLRLDGDITATGPENLVLNIEISKKTSWNCASLSFLRPSLLLIPFSLLSPAPLPI